GASAIAGIAAAALFVLLPAPTIAQTPSTNPTGASSDLLQPSVLGNPATPPRFRKPGQKRPSAEEPPPTNTFAPHRIGATPTSPSGLGAADTGFDSLNVPRSKRKKPPTARAAHDRTAAAGDNLHAGADLYRRPLHRRLRSRSRCRRQRSIR